MPRSHLSLPLELKFGVRMLVKYPGLTIVGGLAMAFAVWVGVIVFEMVTVFTNPSLPLPNGDRVVLIRNWDVETAKADERATHDFVVWRERLRSVADMGAYRDASISLIAPGIESGLVRVAEITSSAFRIAPSAPVLGRVLGPADERPDAPPVVVLGYDVWQKRFAGDARVIGRSVQLGERFATIVGVMPEGFRYPIAHDAWTPLHTDALSALPREGPSTMVFARLAPGVSIEQARAELAVLGRQSAAQLPVTHAHLVPQVLPYTSSFFDPSEQDTRLLFAFNVFAVMLLTLVCSNVALLMFARAATRQAELVVRSALGASRRRIITQLFVEALVLGAVSASVGLIAAYFALDRFGMPYLELNLGQLPFWIHVGLSPLTITYAAGLTLLGAAIASVLPALKVMRGLGAQLREGTSGGGGVRFGGVWTAVIITQVAFTVAFPALAYVEQWQLSRIETFPAGFAAEEYVAAQLDMDVAAGVPEAAAESAFTARGVRLAAALDEMKRRVAAEPGVLGVTFVDRLPRAEHSESRFELEGEPASDDGRTVSKAFIDGSYFDVLETPIVAGRAFNDGDIGPEPRVAIVDRAFVDQVMHGRSAVGRRIRFKRRQRANEPPSPEQPWLEIVGVVKELGMGAPTQMGRANGLYLPTRAGTQGATNIVVHVRGDPLAIAGRLRAIAAAVDPTLELTSLQRVDQVTTGVLWLLGLWMRATYLLIGIALLLSLAGIYSVLSFVVARRTREIGVRVALGSDRRRVVAAIFRRPLTQVTLGVVAGGGVIGLVALIASTVGLEDGRMKPSISAGEWVALLGYAAFMLAVCLLACIVPTRRALSVQPTEALRAE